MMKLYLGICPCFWCCLLAYDLCFVLFCFGSWIPIDTTHSAPLQIKSSSSWQGLEIHDKKRINYWTIKILCKFLYMDKLLVNCGTYKTSFNTIDDSKVMFMDSHMGTLSPFATIISCSLVILTYELKNLRKGVMWLVLLS